MKATLGAAQLERMEELVVRRREFFFWYADGLAGVDGLTLNHEVPGTKSTYWMVTAVLDERFGLQKERFIGCWRQRALTAGPSSTR